MSPPPTQMMHCSNCGGATPSDKPYCQACSATVSLEALRWQVPGGLDPSPQIRVPNRWARNSMILGLVGLLIPIFSPVALTAGMAARIQIQERPLEKGQAMATAGMVLGIANMVLLVVLTAVLRLW